MAEAEGLGEEEMGVMGAAGGGRRRRRGGERGVGDLIIGLLNLDPGSTYEAQSG